LDGLRQGADAALDALEAVGAGELGARAVDGAPLVDVVAERVGGHVVVELAVPGPAVAHAVGRVVAVAVAQRVVRQLNQALGWHLISSPTGVAPSVRRSPVGTHSGSIVRVRFYGTKP